MCASAFSASPRVNVFTARGLDGVHTLSLWTKPGHDELGQLDGVVAPSLTVSF